MNIIESVFRLHNFPLNNFRDEDIEVELQEEVAFSYQERFPNIKTYNGKVVGIPDSSATFTVSDKVILGQIDTGTERYYIEPPNIAMPL